MIKVLMLCALGLLSGCIRVGPDFKPPVAPVQTRWTETAAPITTDAAETPAWWVAYNDPTLDSLIDYAMQQNYTLEAAVDRIAAARANLGVAVGEQYPQTFQLEGSGLRTHISENAPNALTINRNYWDLILGLRVAWELDFWGRFYRGVEAAYGEYRGTVDDFEDVQRLLISDIVLAYVEVKTVLQRIAILERNIAIQYRSVQITEARYESGYESQLDNAQAKALWKQTVSAKEALETEQKRLLTSLALLLGLTPEAFACLFPLDAAFVHLPKEAFTGCPAEILSQRPDIRRNLDLVLAQNARVGIAVSDLYPRISFTGFLGFETTGKNFFSKSSLTFFYGPSFAWPFFSFGRIENRIREQYALLCETIALYRNQVLIAYKETEDALTFFANALEQTEALEEGFASAQRSVDISTLQYQEGIADYSRVLNSLQLQVSLEDELAQARGNIGLAFANIYRSLGIF